MIKQRVEVICNTIDHILAENGIQAKVSSGDFGPGYFVANIMPVEYVSQDVVNQLQAETATRVEVKPSGQIVFTRFRPGR